MEVRKGELVAVVGTVGSGKSSLLSCIMGEMHKVQIIPGLNSTKPGIPGGGVGGWTRTPLVLSGDAGQGELLLQEMVVAGTWYIERQNAVALPKGKNWINPLVSKGHAGGSLAAADMPQVSPSHRAEAAHALLASNFSWIN
ncbi:hypothetical protein QYE76_038270 [Lolium multiflorum]|nr:hypothetical protein QYE76_038270 [Lolium multiflorum]